MTYQHVSRGGFGAGHDDAMDEEPQARRPWPRSALGLTLALVGATALAFKKAATPCTKSLPMLDPASLVSLAEAHAQGLAAIATLHGDREAVRDWLQLSQGSGAPGLASTRTAEPSEGPREAVAKALRERDPERAKALVGVAMNRSLMQWHGKRQGLRAFLEQSERNLKGIKKQSQQASTAECVFNVEQAVAQLAALAANIADSAATCQGEHVDWSSTNGKVCALNLFGIAYSISTIAASLSLAAENCASTLLPNYKALCAGGITGLASMVSQLSGAAALTSAACGEQDGEQPPPHAWGLPGRRLRAEANGTAEARRLLFGGGHQSMGTHCFVDTTSIAWWLAQAALAINAAANPNNFASCRMPFIKRGELYKYAQAVCAVDILGAINGFLQVIQYIQLSVVHCGDVLNLNALCGAGIDAMISALAGMGASGGALWMNCWEAEGWQLKKKAALAKIHQAGMLTKINGLRQEGNFGRRLASDDVAEELEAFQRRFGTPEAAWKSIGIDMHDKDAAFRQLPRPAIRPENLVSLVQAPEVEVPRPGGLLETCS